MGITLGSGQLYSLLNRSTNNTSSKLSASFERLSSGLRVNKASDDPAGLALFQKTDTDRRLYAQTVRNINDGLSVLNIADAAGQSLMDVIGRLREIATTATSSIYTTSQRNAMDTELQALRDEFNRIIETTKYNNKKILDGSYKNTLIQSGITGSSDSFVSIGTDAYAQSTQATGTYSTVVTIDTSTGSSNVKSVIMGDLNNDGYDDIVTADNLSGNLKVSLSNGDGTFQAIVNYSTSAWIGGMVLKDLNNDGYLDLVGASLTTGNVIYRMNNGSGGFGAQTNLASSFQVYNVEAEDIDDDGYLDLISTSESGARINVFLSNGNGTFQPRVSYAVTNGTGTLATAELDGDGFGDVITSVSGGFEVRSGLGDGSLTAPQFYATGINTVRNGLTTADVNGDGYLDVITAAGDGTGNIGISLNNGDGTFGTVTTISVAPGSQFWKVGSGDFNADGNKDLIVSLVSGNSLILEGNGEGSFTTVRTITGTREFSTGDINNDGFDEIVSINNNTSDAEVYKADTASSATLGNISVKTVSKAQQTLDTLEVAEALVLSQVASVGAQSSRLETAAYLSVDITDRLKEATSRIRDIDYATEISESLKLQIIQNVATSLYAQANISSKLALILLGNNNSDDD